MTAAIRQSLTSLQSNLQRLGRYRLLRSLSPGLHPGETDRILASMGLASSPDIEALFEWHNGNTFDPSLTLADLWMYPFFYMLSLEDAASYYTMLCDSGRVGTTWFPVFADGGGDFMLVDLSVNGGDVYHFRNEFPECPREYSSLTAMMRTMVAAFEHEIYFVDDSLPEIQIDFNRFNELAAAMNPSIDWWNSSSLA